MIFSPENVAKILAGKKTETRRIVKPGEIECRYKADRDYAVQPGRGRKSAGRILVTEVWREAVGWITDNAARREGFSNASQFKDYWSELHGEFDPETRVWVIRFEVVS